MLRFLTASAAGVFLSGAAFAADLPISEPPMMDEEMAPAAAFDWTGAYVGVNGGWAWGDPRWTTTNNTSAVPDTATGQRFRIGY